MAITSTTELLTELVRCKALAAPRAEELRRDARFVQLPVRTAAQELMQGGWLTPFQVNQVLQGHGAKLLLKSYVLLEKIGEGGMGAVFKARNWKLDRIVAVKLIRKERLANPTAVRRFQRETVAAAQLNHPNIVRALDADEAAGTHFFVMEFVEGIDLHELVRKHGPLTVAEACACVRQAALGLQHAHERGMVHRDIKPHNLLLTSATGGNKANRPSVADGIVKILDMGLARIESEDDAGHSSTITQEGVVMGTPDYMAPEQSLDSHSVDIRGDLYGLGCTLYFLLTGKPPFSGGALAEKLLKHQLHAPAPLTTLRPDVPAPVAAIAARLLAKRPEDRFQTPSELAAALDHASRPLTETLSAPAGGSATSMDATQPAPQSAPSATDVVARREWAAIAPTPEPKASPSPAAPPRWLAPVLSGVVALALVAGGISWWVAQPAETKPPDDGPVVTLPPRLKPLRIDNGSKHLSPEPLRWKAGPVTDEWVAQVQARPADEQAKAVFAKLKELNPGFDDQHSLNGRQIVQNKVVALAFFQPVTDISPVRALIHLEQLEARPSPSNIAPAPTIALADLAPLRHLKKLKTLNLVSQRVVDLGPLRALPLETLTLTATPVRDLSPLGQLSTLRHLRLDHTPVADLAPLQGLNLTTLGLINASVTDLRPLAGMRLVALEMGGVRVRDLTPLNVSLLRKLDIALCPIEDLAPLAQARQLASLRIDGVAARSLEPLRSLPLQSIVLNYNARHEAILRGLSCKTINLEASEDFWKAIAPGPEHDAFVQSVSALTSADQVQAVAARLTSLNPGSEPKAAHNADASVVTRLEIDAHNLKNLTPLAALKGLRHLKIVGDTGLTNLAPLRGLPLEHFSIDHCAVLDIGPLEGMPLKTLMLVQPGGPLRNLTPLAGMRGLTDLNLSGVVAANLRPLAETPLEVLTLGHGLSTGLEALPNTPLKKVRMHFAFAHHADALRSMKSLAWINDKKVDDFWNDQARLRGEFVRRELKRLNPGFAGKFEPTIKDGGVESLRVQDDDMTDLSPLQHLPELQTLWLGPMSYPEAGKLSDIAPLAGMKLTHLRIERCPVKDLKPLVGMPLVSFVAHFTAVDDLAPLRGMKLSELGFAGSRITDLSPLRGMKLLVVSGDRTPVQDFRVLADMPLQNVTLNFDVHRDHDWLRSIGSLQVINNKPAAGFWKDIDDQQSAFGAWCDLVAREPDARKQVELVAAKLKERNGNFDGKVVADYVGQEAPRVAGLAFCTDYVADLSPVRALKDLQRLDCCGSGDGLGKLTSLWPLRDLGLTELAVVFNPVSDFTPLARLPLARLRLDFVRARDAAVLGSIKSLKTINGQPAVDVLR